MPQELLAPSRAGSKQKSCAPQHAGLEPAMAAPAEQRGAGHPALGVLEQPPAVRQAEGQRQEVGLARQLVGNQQATCIACAHGASGTTHEGSADPCALPCNQRISRKCSSMRSQDCAPP